MYMLTSLFPAPPIASTHLSPEGSVEPGSMVTLTCSALDGNLPINYTWTNPDGDTIATVSTTQVDIFFPEDYGSYTCIVDNALGEDESSVDVLYPGMFAIILALSECYIMIDADIPILVRRDDFDEAILGENYTLASIIHFNRSITSIVWEYQGNVLSSTDQRMSISQTLLPVYGSGPAFSTLRLSFITREDAGEYSVTASNVDGADTLVFNVTVIGMIKCIF